MSIMRLNWNGKKLLFCRELNVWFFLGVVAATAGTLTFMVGGEESEFAAAKELLEHMGKNVIRCGNVGTGLTAKICNNMLLAVSMIGVSEALNLGNR